MGVRVFFFCGGCDARTEPVPLRRQFVPVNPGGSLGSFRTEDVQALAPEGWVAFDPYTQMTYCPECWASISEPVVEPEQQAEERA